MPASLYTIEYDPIDWELIDDADERVDIVRLGSIVPGAVIVFWKLGETNDLCLAIVVGVKRKLSPRFSERWTELAFIGSDAKLYECVRGSDIEIARLRT